MRDSHDDPERKKCESCIFRTIDHDTPVKVNWIRPWSWLTATDAGEGAGAYSELLPLGMARRSQARA